MKIPCLILWSRDNNIRSAPSEKYLYTCFENEVSKYNDSIMLDSEQNVFYIKKVEKVGWGTRFWGLSLLYKHRMIKIKYDIERIEQADLNKIKNILISKVEKKPHGRFMLEYFESIENLKSQILSSNNIKNLIELFVHD